MSEDDLPGMWSLADFEGGDTDERSYAERGWDPKDYSKTISVVPRLVIPPEPFIQLGWMNRYILGVEPDAEVAVRWGNPELPKSRISMTFDHVDPDVLELLFGEPLIPLGAREIPARGQE